MVSIKLAAPLVGDILEFQPKMRQKVCKLMSKKGCFSKECRLPMGVLDLDSVNTSAKSSFEVKKSWIAHLGNCEWVDLSV